MTLPLAAFPDGATVPALGLGTWRMGEDPRKAKMEVEALRAGLDLGLTLIDTAEMYGSGGSEKIVGEAIRGRRDEAFLVSKVMPSNASRSGTIRACEASLKHLGVETIDLYLLHWPGRHPLAETVDAFEDLKSAGKIARWGVSNFDKVAMEALVRVPGGKAVATNQVYYNAARRGVEFDLLPWMAQRGLPLMAYSPLDEGRLAQSRRLGRIAATLELTPAQLALAFLLSRRNVIAIPKTSSVGRVREMRASAEVRLTEADLAQIDDLFPPPRAAEPLDMV